MGNARRGNRSNAGEMTAYASSFLAFGRIAPDTGIWHRTVFGGKQDHLSLAFGLNVRDMLKIHTHERRLHSSLGAVIPGVVVYHTTQGPAR